MTDAIRRSRLRRGRDDDATPRPARHRIPDLSPLTSVLAQTGELRSLVERYANAAGGRVGQELRHVTYAGMPHGAKTYLAAALAEASGERLVWIARDAEIADRVAEELAAWLGSAEHVVTLEPRTALAFERSELVRDESAARVAALAVWSEQAGPARILVASLQALFQRTLGPADIPADPMTVTKGARLAMDRVVGALVKLGYEHVPEVGGRGEFARRGGIVDVFPAGQPLPVRIEWFGDEVDSLRAFDPADQRGAGPLGSAALLPASEFLLGPDVRDILVERMRRTVERLPDALQEDLARFDSGTLGDAAELWGGYLAPHTAIDHLGRSIWLIDEPAEVATVAGLPAVTGGRPTGGAGARRRDPGALGHGLPHAARVEDRAPRGAHARADLGTGGRWRPSGWQPVRLARTGPAAGPHRRPGRHRASLACRG